MRRTLIYLIALVAIAGAAHGQSWTVGPGDTVKIPLKLKDSIANPAAVDSAADSVLIRVIKNFGANASGADTCYLHRGLMDASTNTLLHTTGDATTTLGFGQTPKRVQTFSFFATAYTLTGSATASGTYSVEVWTYDHSLNLITEDSYTLNYIYFGTSTGTYAMWADSVGAMARWAMKTVAPDSNSAGNLTVDAAKIGGQTASAAGTVTFPGTIASSTNITAATGVTVSTMGTNSIPNAAFQSQPAVNVTIVDGTALATHTAGYFPSDNRYWVGGAIPSPNVTGVPIVDMKYILGTQTDTTGASGRLAVNMRYVANQLCAASAGVTFPASIASPTNITSASGVSLAADQAVNVTKIDGTAWSTHASGMVPADMRDVAGAAVSTSTAQFGVNAVQIGGTAQSSGMNLATYLPAIFDTTLMLDGKRVGCKAKWRTSAASDTLTIYAADGSTPLQKNIYYHPGGAAGDPPNDTSKTVAP